MKKANVKLLGTTFEAKRINDTAIRLTVDDICLKGYKIGNNYVENSFANLLVVAEHFGTTDIGFNKINVSHCDTCGDEYIWEPEVFNITKNNPFGK